MIEEVCTIRKRGQNSEDVSRSQGDGMLPVKTFPDRVERAGADIPINHPEGAAGEQQRAGF